MNPIHHIIAFLIIILLLPLSSISQSDTLNRVDEKGMKQGYWVIYGRDMPDKGYSADGKIEEGIYKDDRKNGVWIKYHKDGKTPRLEGTYVNNRPNGPYKKFYESGIVMEEGNFSGGKLIGDQIIFYESGCMAKYQNDSLVIKYLDDCQNNLSYQAAGTIDTTYSIKRDSVKRKNGYTRYYEDSGGGCGQQKNDNDTRPILHTEGDCNYYTELESAENGKHKLFDADGRLIIDGKIEDGWLLDGEMYCYQEDGRIKTFKYKDGKVIKHWWEYPNEK